MSSITKDHLRTISVQGTGTMFAVPDIARIHLNFLVKNSTAETAQRSITADMRGAESFLHEEGIPDKDIRSTRARVQMIAKYDKNHNLSGYTGYQIQMSMVVTVRQMDAVDRILGRLATLSSYQLEHVAYDLSEVTHHEREARRIAVHQARERADELAHHAGARVVGIFSLVERRDYEISSRSARVYSDHRSMSDDHPVPTHPGEQEISVTVEAIFEIAPIGKGEGA